MDNRPDTTNNPYWASKASIVDVTSSCKIEPAGRLVRLCAGVFDFLILYAIYILFFGPFGRVLVHILVPGTAVYLVINFRLLRDHGQTVGKYIFKTRIVRSDGTPANIWRILFRRYFLMFIILLIIFIGLVFIIGFVNRDFVIEFIRGYFYCMVLIDILPFFRSSRKCLHDIIADTIVVKVSKRSLDKRSAIRGE